MRQDLQHIYSPEKFEKKRRKCKALKIYKFKET